MERSPPQGPRTVQRLVPILSGPAVSLALGRPIDHRQLRKFLADEAAICEKMWSFKSHAKQRTGLGPVRDSEQRRLLGGASRELRALPGVRWNAPGGQTYGLTSEWRR
jgi:hypothetical protein